MVKLIKSSIFMKIKKETPSFTIEQYLQLCQDEILEEEYYFFEEKRIFNYNKISSSNWIEIIKKQYNRCYYCNTDIRIIQHLIINKILKPRKRGVYGYSGLHLELEHKNADKKDNSFENLVASCYYCNNDKSNTISSEYFKKYFGPSKNSAFQKMIKDHLPIVSDKFHHNLKGKS